MYVPVLSMLVGGAARARPTGALMHGEITKTYSMACAYYMKQERPRLDSMMQPNANKGKILH